MMKYAIGLLVFSLLFAGCVFQQQVETQGNETTQLPNPAAVNCADKGYAIETRTNEAGEYGVCKYQGKECDEWDLYRRDCCLQDSDCSCTEGTAKCENQECTCETEEPEVPVEEPEEIPEEPEENETGETLPEYSGKTIDEFLDEGIETIRTEFFRTHDGDFVTRSVKWSMAEEDAKPDEITITAGLENAVQFNGESSNKIRGFGFMLFTPAEGGLADAGGIAVFNARDTLLDVYYDNKELDLDIIYSFNTKVYEMHNCEVTEKDHYLADDSSWITNYMFECEYGEQIS